MKRSALLFANANATGSKIDIENWMKFLESDNGGAWYPYEINKLINPSLGQLQKKIQEIKVSNIDFCLVVYAGHGGWKRSTILEINPEGETISEISLKGLATREILSLDCCRGTNALVEGLEKANDGLYSNSESSYIRKMYDERMMQAIPQQVTLYACSIGESAYCNNEGGYYTRNLLSCCSDVQNGFKTINKAHLEAAKKTTLEVYLQENQKQYPDIANPRCLSFQQLIIGIDPSMCSTCING